MPDYSKSRLTRAEVRRLKAIAANENSKGYAVVRALQMLSKHRAQQAEARTVRKAEKQMAKAVAAMPAHDLWAPQPESEPMESSQQQTAAPAQPQCERAPVWRLAGTSMLFDLDRNEVQIDPERQRIVGEIPSVLDLMRLRRYGIKLPS